MIWTGLAVGAVIGLAVGWRAGRLHMYAGQRWWEWRGTVRALPGIRRQAFMAVRDAVGYVLGAVMLVGVAGVVVWYVAVR